MKTKKQLPGSKKQDLGIYGDNKREQEAGRRLEVEQQYRKTYLLVEVDLNNNESIQPEEVKGLVTALLTPVDAHDPLVRVWELEMKRQPMAPFGDLVSVSALVKK